MAKKLPKELCLTEGDFELSEEVIEVIGDYLYDKYGKLVEEFDYKIDIANIKWNSSN